MFLDSPKHALPAVCDDMNTLKWMILSTDLTRTSTTPSLHLYNLSQSSAILWPETLLNAVRSKVDCMKRVFRCMWYLSIEIRAPLNFAPLIFAPLIFAHPQILRPFNFRALLFYCTFAVFSFIRGIFTSPFNFHTFILLELAPFNFRAG